MRRITGAAFANVGQASTIAPRRKNLQDAQIKTMVANSRGDLALVYFDFGEGHGDKEYNLIRYDSTDGLGIPALDTATLSTEEANIATLWNSDLLWEGKGSLKLKDGLKAWAIFDDNERLIELTETQPEKNSSHKTTMLEIKDNHIYPRGSISPLSFGYQLDIVNWLVFTATPPKPRLPKPVSNPTINQSTAAPDTSKLTI